MVRFSLWTKILIILGVGASLCLLALGVPTYYGCTFTSFFSAALLLSLGPAFRPAGVGSLLIAISWIVNGYFKSRGINTYFYYDELFRIPGYLLFFPTIGKLEWKRRPKYALWLLASIALVSLIYTALFVIQSRQIPKDALLYIITFLAVLWVAAPKFEAFLWGEAPFERFFWLLGFILLWVGILLKIPDELGVGHLRQHSDAVSVLGFLFLGIGFAEAKQVPLGLWPFTVGVGSLLLAWSFGMVGLQGSSWLVFRGWVDVGVFVVFLSTLSLILGFKERLTRSERILRGLAQLSETAMPLPTQTNDPSQELGTVFCQIKSFLEGLSGVELDTIPPVRLGETTPYFRPITSKGQTIGRAFFETKAAAFELSPFLPILASRLRALALQMHLKVEAMTDTVTGLLNRRGFLQTLEATLEDSRLEGKGFSLPFLDVDNLKLVNDGYGHRAGDQLLTFFAQVLKQSTRQGDILSRWGGDEFLLALIGADEKVALDIFERIRELTKRSNTLPAQWIWGFSGGLVFVPSQNSLPIEYWIQQADAALYRAKNQGKGRVIVHRARTDPAREEP